MRRFLAIIIVIASFSIGWFWMLYEDSISHSEGRWFEWLVRIEGAASKIQAGEYEFSPGLTPRQILVFLVKGRVNQYAITIIDGQTFKQFLSDIQQHPAVKKTLPKQASMAQYVELLNIPEKNMEGLLLAETYFFIKGTSDVALIKRAYRAMQVYVNTNWLKRDKKAVIDTVYKALILASIVEKETGLASERKKIAGLFIRRLEIGMKLQTDPTVIYGMGDEYKGDIRFRDLRTDTAYNTYTRYGLPPTPIAMPGKAAIDAVLHPEKTRSLYFVANGDGSHVFSKTLKQHNAAVNKYQRNK